MPNREGESLRPKDQEPKENRLGIFADDDFDFATTYSRPFTGLPSFTPIIIGTGFIREAKEKLEAIKLDLVDVVVAEQYYDNYPVRQEMSQFIRRLRGVNSHAWIVETGGAAFNPIYQGSNRVLDTLDMLDMSRVIDKTPPTVKARLHALKVFTTEGFVEARKASEGGVRGLYGIGETDMSLKRFGKNPHNMQVLELLSIDYDNLCDKLQNVPEKLIPEAMHTLWTVVGHLQLGNGPDYYGMSLDRLRGLIGGKN